jgi:glycosyltransferase involved in cell wall biosynthesis
MCTHNGLPVIVEAVRDILGQAYPNIELMISDDCSSDGTREWLATLSDPRLRLFCHEANLGYQRNKNFLHRQARGEFIAQQDADDTSALDRIELQHRALRESGCKIAGCGFAHIDETGAITGRVALAESRVITAKGDDEYPFWFPALMVHRSVFEEVGLFSDYFAGAFGDDLYWTVRANERFPIYCLADVLYGYRHGQGSITSLLDNPRKIVMTGVLAELLRQRARTGTDLLEQGRREDLCALEQQLFRNRRFRSSQLRAWAARYVDSGELRAAWTLLARAWISWPIHAAWYRTAFYWLRQTLRR